MFRNYIDYRKSRIKSSVYHNFRGEFGRFETAVFMLLCVIFLITSKINHKITDGFAMIISNVAMPVSNVVSVPFNLVISLSVDFNELINARNHNEELLKENEKLKSLYIKSLSVIQENKQIKETTKYISLRSSEFTVAHLIGRSYQTYSNHVFISAGSIQDVKENDIVTGNNTLIGRIIQVGENKSRVLLVTDVSSRIPIVVSGSGVRGILSGNNSDLMEILYLEKDHEIKVGDLVFSSSDGDSIPPGMLVGVVVKTDKRYAAVRMVEDINRLDMVSVSRY